MAEEIVAAQETTETPVEPTPEVTLLPGETQEQEPKEGEVQAGEPDAKPVVGAPEKYEFAPIEGFEVDEALAGTFEPLLRKHGITNEAANELAGEFAKLMKSNNEALDQRITEQVKGWAAESAADKDIKANLDLGNKTFAKMASPGLQSLLAEYGMVNHPEVIKHFIALGKMSAEDTHVPSGNATTPKSQAEVMFPTMFAKA